MTKIFGHALQNDKSPLATRYGAIVALGELGTEVSVDTILHDISRIVSTLNVVGLAFLMTDNWVNRSSRLQW